MLYDLDRTLSQHLGRYVSMIPSSYLTDVSGCSPLGIDDEEIDLDLPAELSDEELDHYEAANLPYPRSFPASKKPVPISAFVCFTRLNQITSKTLKTLYGSQESRKGASLSSNRLLNFKPI